MIQVFIILGNILLNHLLESLPLVVFLFCGLIQCLLLVLASNTHFVLQSLKYRVEVIANAYFTYIQQNLSKLMSPATITGNKNIHFAAANFGALFQSK